MLGSYHEEERRRNAEQMRNYRARNREHMREYDRKRYREQKAVPEKEERWGDKVCNICGVRMAGEWGADGTFKYCGSCSSNPQVKRYIRLLATRRWRAKHLGVPFVPITFEEMLCGENVRRSPGNAKRYDKKREERSHKYDHLIFDSI